jgi:hypothetical protein
MYLLSAVAYLKKAIIQPAAERHQGGGDASATDHVSGVGTLNEIYCGKKQIGMFSNIYGVFTIP